MPSKAPIKHNLSLTASVAIKAAEEGVSQRRFRLDAYTGEPMSVWGYDLPIVVDLATIDLSSQRIPALYDHIADERFIVGQIESIKVEGPNLTPPLVAEGVFTPLNLDPEDAGDDFAARVIARADAGYQWQASVGCDPKRVDRVEAGQSVNVNGRDYPGPVLIARGVVLREISFVVLGADRRTNAVVASRIKGGGMKFEEWLTSMGFDETAQTNMSDIQKTNMQSMYDKEMKAETPPEETPNTTASAKPPAIQASTKPDPIAVRRQLEAAEEERIAGIRASVAKHGVDKIKINSQEVSLVAHAIREGWTVEKTELEALRAGRTSGPAIITRSEETDCNISALQGAIMLRAGARLDSPAYQHPDAYGANIPKWLRAGINDANRNQIMENAHRYRDMSLVDVCAHALRIDGKEVPHNRRDMIQAAFSGGTLTSIFTSSVNAVLLSSYLAAEDTTQAWTKTVDVADFKTQERPRMEIMGSLSKLPRGGTADHGKRSDKLESYKVSRYAQQFVIDEQDIIDDMLNALGDTPQQMGAAAARLRPDLVYSILLSNPALNATGRALFNTTEGNLGSSAALAAATLRAAVSAMYLIQENGVNLNLRPTHLIVPPSLRHLSMELINSSQILIAGTAGSVTERGSMNALLADQLTPVADARLENGVVDPDSGTVNAGSATTWYLASTLAHTIEVGYQRSTGRTPRVRSFQLDRGQYGIGWDVSLDVGAKAMDWRGLRKTTA